MESLLFFITFVVSILFSLFGWTQTINAWRAEQKDSKEMFISFGWVAAFVAVGVCVWYFLSAGFMGYVCGLLVSLSVTLSAILPKKDNQDDSKGND